MPEGLLGWIFALASPFRHHEGVSLEGLPSPRRKRSSAAVRSPAALFLHFAARNLDEADRLQGEQGPHRHPSIPPGVRWRVMEHRLSCVRFATAALEAHVLALHQVFFAHQMTQAEGAAWRRLPLSERLQALLPKRVLSPRRRNLLQEVLALEERISRPPPFQVAEQIELFAPTETRSSADFWFGSARGAWVKVPLRQSDEPDEARPAGLPDDPAELSTPHVLACLLVLLEHALLLDRAYPEWSEWPLSLFHDGQARSAGEWFQALRERYEGPQAAYFRRIRTELQAGDDDEANAGPG